MEYKLILQSGEVTLWQGENKIAEIKPEELTPKDFTFGEIAEALAIYKILDRLSEADTVRIIEC